MKLKNKKATFEYSLLDKYTAGIQLIGSEIKSIRENRININQAYCKFINNELNIIGMHIDPYTKNDKEDYISTRNRKLLLTKKELYKLKDKLKDKGLTIIPVSIFINKKGLAKLEIALGKGKKLFDKRQNIKKKDIERDLKRKIK